MGKKNQNNKASKQKQAPVKIEKEKKGKKK
jgi:hypothetical protein